MKTTCSSSADALPAALDRKTWSSQQVWVRNKIAGVRIALSTLWLGRALRPPAGLLLALSLHQLAAPEVRAQGIPEPDLILYGKIRNVQSIDPLRMSSGNLTWQMQPLSGGAPIFFSTPVTNVNDQFSYVLRVPCQTQVAGFPLASNALRLGSSYDRSVVFYNGTNRASLLTRAFDTLNLAATDRGRIERIDLEVSAPVLDLDGNGLPDDWERQYFGRTGIDPFADDDGDGLNNLDEYRAGTNPRDSRSHFAFIRIKARSGGIQIEWSSVSNRVYRIQRSAEVQTGYVDIVTGLRANPPINSYIDPTATGRGPYFYRLRLEE